MYRSVNAKFADAACAEIPEAGSPVVLVQDYHFALAPRMIRDRLPAERHCVVLAHSLAGAARLRGLSVVARPARGAAREQRRRLPDADRCQELHRYSRASSQGACRPASSTRSGMTAARRSSAAARSVEWPNRWARELPPVEICRREVNLQLGLTSHARLCVGVDRMDYTKGLVEKFLAVERMLERSPSCASASSSRSSHNRRAMPCRHTASFNRAFARRRSASTGASAPPRISRSFCSKVITIPSSSIGS